jgi:hypothetical protein
MSSDSIQPETHSNTLKPKGIVTEERRIVRDAVLAAVLANVCPDCGTELWHEGGCCICPGCAWSKC